MSKGKMGCIPKVIIYSMGGIATLALISYIIDQANPGAGSALWEGLGQLALDLLKMIQEAMS